MNRPIKLRAWDKNNNQWLHFNIRPFFYQESELAGERFKNVFEGKKIDPDHIYEYTGHKDKNDVEICEGDIIKVNIAHCFTPYESGEDFDNDYYAVVVYRPSRGFFGKVAKIVDNLFGAEVPENQRHESVRITQYRTEVVGNIYENPDLLKENNDH